MITVQIATIPQKLAAFTRALQSLLPQIDRANIILNNFEEVPPVCLNEKVKVIRGDNKHRDLSKFTDAEKLYGYVFICDDDILYPPDFVAFMKAKYWEHGGIVTCMGKNLKPRPIQSYFKDEVIHYKTFEAVDRDVLVEVPGACALLYSSVDVTLSLQDVVSMNVPNSDLCVAKYAKDHGIKCRVVAHPADFLRNLMPMVYGAPTMFDLYQRDDSVQTAFVNAHL